MTNPEFLTMIERFHKPAKNVKIKAAYVLVGIGIIGIAYFAIKSSVTKSKEIRQLKNLTSRSAMLEHDLQQNESIIESLNKEKKELVAKIEKAKNSAVSSKIEKNRRN